jgi:hypothetical protein
MSLVTFTSGFKSLWEQTPIWDVYISSLSLPFTACPAKGHSSQLVGGILWPVRLSQLARSICVLPVWVRSVASAAGKFRAWVSRGFPTVSLICDLEFIRSKK